MALVSRVSLSFLLSLFPVSFAYFISTYNFLSIRIPLLNLIHFIFLKTNLRPCAVYAHYIRQCSPAIIFGFHLCQWQAELEALQSKIARMQQTLSGTSI